MPVTLTPLRYPGGKNGISGLLREVIKTNNLSNPIYAEPYCGGAGAALNLLTHEVVSEIYLNDIDPAVYAFWRVALEKTEALCDRIDQADLSIAEWDKQRGILLRRTAPTVELAFATLYLNRVNRSGILRGGVIGGREQNGDWKMDARFNKEDLIRKLHLLARYRERIHVFRLDAMEFVLGTLNKLTSPVFTYLDPPYVKQGSTLYENHYQRSDHEAIAKTLRERFAQPWIASYDSCALIRRLYGGLQQSMYRLNYSAQDRKVGREIVIYGPTLKRPRRINVEMLCSVGVLDAVPSAE